MRQNNKYDISSTFYTQRLDEKTEEYNALINRAGQINFQNKGEPSKREAELYCEAIKVCEEIMSLNVTQLHVKTQWEQRKMFCEDEANRIIQRLMPKPPAKPQDDEKPKKVVEKVKPEAKKVDDSKKYEGLSEEEIERKKRIRAICEKHAIKEVPADEIEKWFKDIPSHDFSAIIGRDDIKKRLIDQIASLGWDKLDDALKISPVQCYFLYGPPGTGKTFLIEAFAKELQKYNFGFMQLLGSEVHASYVGVAEKIVKIAFDVALEQEACLVFMDEIDNLCVERSNGKAEGHEKRLTTAFLEAYNRFKKSNKRMIFIGATNHPASVDMAMMDRISLIRIPLPSKVERVGYFDRIVYDKKKEKQMIAMEEGFTTEDMADATDNHSYRDLDRLRDYMLNQLKVQAIEACTILDENGQIDKVASDEAASKAVKEGKIMITRDLFEKAQKDNIPSDKTESRLELQAFEDRVTRGNG